MLRRAQVRLNAFERVVVITQVQNLVLGGVLALDDAVQAGTDDGDGAANQRLRGDLVAKGENAEANDKDALTDVTDGVSHRGNLTEGLVRDLVVHVVVETDRGERHEELLLTLERDGLLDAGAESGAFKVKGKRQAEEESDDGDPVVQVERGHLAHELLREDGARGEGDVGAHRRQKAQPGEGELRGGGDGDAEDHRQEGKVNRKRVHGTGNQVRTNRGEHRLQSLDGVGEGHRNGGKGHIRQAVTKRVQKRRQGERLEEILIRLLVFNQLGRPEETHDEQTNKQVDARHEPRVREVVVDLLVDNVKLHVQKVPSRKVKDGFQLRVLFLNLRERTAVRSSARTRQKKRQSNRLRQFSIVIQRPDVRPSVRPFNQTKLTD
jgi:hypothetical protein